MYQLPERQPNENRLQNGASKLQFYKVNYTILANHHKSIHI